MNKGPEDNSRPSIRNQYALTLKHQEKSMEMRIKSERILTNNSPKYMKTI